MAVQDNAVTPSPAPDTGLTPERGLSASLVDHMVRKLTDIIVLPAARLSANERSVAADIMLQVLSVVDEDQRLEVARRVCRVAELPSAMMRMLLLDEPSVASVIIRNADSIPDALLIECAREGTTAHRELIARRIDLTAPVADVILEHEEPEVARLLLRREEFQFSPNAIERLVARSPSDTEMQGLLLRRRELEPAHGFMMFWWVDSERRKRILSRYALDRAIIQDSLQDLYPKVFGVATGSDPLVREILIMLDRRHRPRGVNGEPVGMDVVGKTLLAARRYPSHEIVHAVSMVAGVTRELAARILRDPGVEPFAVLCKSLGLPRAEFFRILQDKNAERPLDAPRAEDVLGVFDGMARDFSRAILRYWDWNGNPRIARVTRLLGLDVGPE